MKKLVLPATGFLCGQPFEVEAEVRGPLCVHRAIASLNPRKRWRVAHVKTGAAIGGYVTKAQGLRIVRRLLAALPATHPMWLGETPDDVAVLGGDRAKKRVRTILRAEKAL